MYNSSVIALCGSQTEGSNDSQAEEENERDGNRRIFSNAKNVPEGITLVNEQCCCMLIMPDDKCAHCKMPCGHIISPMGCYEYLKKSIMDAGEFDVKCPMTGCNQTWDLKLSIWVAAATIEEEKLILEKINLNMINHPSSGITQCPNCSAYVSRPKNLLVNRVHCPVCKRKDWCWWCHKEWIGYDNQICIRQECSHNAAVAHLLINCRKAEISGIKNVPVYRLCPDCGALIKWKENCKHVTCINCKHEFCFSCLQNYKNFGVHNGQACNVAATQSV